MSALPPVTVVLAVCNHAATLRAVIDALDATDWPDLEVVAIDCGSSDGSLDQLRARAASDRGVRFTCLHAPGSGRASAFNQGFAAAGRRDVVRLHADVVPDDPRWLRQLHDVLRQEPECGVLGAKIVLAGGRIQTCGRDLIRGLGIGEEGSDRRWLEGDSDEASRPTEVDAVSGELCWIRRAVLDATGGLDPAYDPVFGDDDDFCLLARWHGFRVLVEPGVRAVHYAPRLSTTTCLQPTEPTGMLAESLSARSRLKGAHRRYFQDKWGFDPRQPDLHEIRRRYGHTRICWRIGERLTERLPERPAVDVCLVTWNSMQVLPRMLDHLAATRWPEVHVWITDNGSTDGTLEYLEQRRSSFPFPIAVRHLPTNVGVAPALNSAFQSGSAPLVARLDDDTIVPPEWLEHLVPRFHQRPYAGMVGPKVLHDNEGAGLQNGPLRVWPGPFAGLHGGSAPQVDGLVRVVTIRGCCNVYRRSVFREAGWLDVRYAPSQFDEWDHHLAVVNAGYEVLYDGSIAVRHLLTAGRMATPSSLGNFQGNLEKTRAKWGPDHFRAFDGAIDLSIDGRCLPADGDTRALRARLPAVPPGPPVGPPRDASEVRELSALARRRSLLRHPTGPLTAWWNAQIELGETALEDGNNTAMAMAMKVMDLLPHDARAMAFLARYRASEGDATGAARTARLALRLAPDDAALRRYTATAPTRTSATLVPAAPRASNALPRVLLLAPMELGDDAGHHALAVTAAALRAAQVPFRIADEFVPVLADEEVVHAFSFAEATTLLPRLQAVRAQRPACRIVLTPLVADPGPANWYGTVVGDKFLADDSDLMRWFAAAAAGQLVLNGNPGRYAAPSGPDDALAYERACMQFVDALLLHRADDTWLQSRVSTAVAAHTLPDGLLATAAPAADADETTAVPIGGVLAIGPRDLPHNHLPLVLAARELPIPLTLCGRPAHPYGEWRTRRRAAATTRWLARPRGDALLTAIARSAVFAWLPTSPSSFALPLQAAALGCELVLTRGVGAEAVFGERAHYVDPLDLAGLRLAITRAHANWAPDARDEWRAGLREQYGPAAHASALLAVYGLRPAAGALPAATRLVTAR